MKVQFTILFIVLLFGKVSFSQTLEVYTDTLVYAPYEFTVNETKFRFKLNQEAYIVSIEKLNSTWNLIDTANFFQKIFLKDINNDGFLDIGFYEKWITEVWLFNPKKNLFIASGEYPTLEFEDGEKHMVLLDKKLQVYYNYWWYKHGEWGSELFMLRNYKKVILGSIENDASFSSKKGDYITKAIIIMKLDNGKAQKIKEIPGHNKKYDYTYYWQLNWRKFLSK